MMPARLADNVDTLNVDNQRHNHQASKPSDTTSHSNHSPMKSRSHSERRHRHHQPQNPNTQKTRDDASIDSGAGPEDEDTPSEDIEATTNHRHKSRPSLIRHISDTGTDRPFSSSSSLRRKTSSKRSKSQSAGSQRPRSSKHHAAATSDSAVSTSVLSTSGLSTPTESRIFSSPNLSDQSKTSISPKHSGKTTPALSSSSSNYPPLTKALRKKQERLKRELDIKQTRYQIQRQQFMADTYRHHRVGSLKRKDSGKGSNSNPNRTLQKSLSVDESTSHTASIRDSPYASTAPTSSSHQSPSSKNDGRNNKMKKEYRSRSVGRDEVMKADGEKKEKEGHRNERLKESELVSPRSKNRDEGNDVTSPPTTNGSTDKHQPLKNNDNKNDGVERELDDVFHNVDNNDNDNNNNNNKSNGEKKQKRKSRKDRSSSSRRRHLDSSNDLDPDAAPVTSSGGDDDPFEHLARKLHVSTSDGDHVTTPSSSAGDLDLETRMKQTVDSIGRDGMPDIPSTEQITETGLLDWRAVFRVEMMRLRREVNEFRVYCQNQIIHQAASVSGSGSHNKPHDATHTKDPDVQATQQVTPPPPVVASQLKDLEANMKLFQKKQELLDLETELLAQEERLADKQNHLEEYEKEILEVESMLNHRQSICDRRQKTLLNLDEELQSLRTELEETREQMQVDGAIPESNSERARKNWDMLKRNLMDEQKLLETTVQKYRSELASATSTIAGKDILISRLQSVAMQHEEEIAARDKRIKQLESKLSIALSETKNLLDQLPSASQQNLHASKTTLESDSGGVMSRAGLSSADTSNVTATTTTRTSSPSAITNNNNAAANSENQRLASFRSTRSYYRRPSSNDHSSYGDDNSYTLNRHRRGSGSGGGGGLVNGDATGGGGSGSGTRNSFRTSMSARKRNSVSDNAISRLTLSTPRSETSSACVVQ